MIYRRLRHPQQRVCTPEETIDTLHGQNMVFLIETRGPVVNNTKAVALGGYRAKFTGE
jgi:hypothetical protein